MYGHNVFAVLTPIDKRNNARSAFYLPQNAKWLRRVNGGVAEVPTIDSRQPTPATGPSMDETSDATDRLILTFDELPRDLPNGVQFGTNPRSSHVLLGHRGTQGISARQYNITVDDELRIWLRDYSTHGTAVGYNGQNETEFRKGQTWILCLQPGIPNIFEEITIHSGHLAIQVMFPNHEAADLRYLQYLRETLKKSSEAVPPLDGLGLDSNPDTATPSQAQTSTGPDIYFEETRIGCGAFGEVMRAIRTRDAKFVAIKKFSPRVNKRGRDGNDSMWLQTLRREFYTMKDNPHVYVP